MHIHHAGIRDMVMLTIRNNDVSLKAQLAACRTWAAFSLQPLKPDRLLESKFENTKPRLVAGFLL